MMISVCQQVLEFGALEKSMIKFLRMTMMHLLTSTATSDLNLIFRRVGQLQKLRNLSDGLRVFLTKYIKVKKLDGDQMKSVKDKLSEVCGELSLNRQTVLWGVSTMLGDSCICSTLWVCEKMSQNVWSVKIKCMVEKTFLFFCLFCFGELCELCWCSFGVCLWSSILCMFYVNRMIHALSVDMNAWIFIHRICIVVDLRNGLR